MSDAGPADDRVVLHPSWKRVLLAEFEKPYMQNLRSFLLHERRARKAIYPRGPEIFAALDLTPPENVRVVIIGQDPLPAPLLWLGPCNAAHDWCIEIVGPGGVPVEQLADLGKNVVGLHRAVVSLDGIEHLDDIAPGYRVDLLRPDPRIDQPLKQLLDLIF